MPYTQFCAGTDTEYISTRDDPEHQRAQAAGYDDYESLSKLFDGLHSETAAIVHHPYEATRPKPTLLAAEKDGARFVNGPATRGDDVGACIVNNLFGILQALAKGETTLNLVAHSRGAVSAILVTHELDALRKALAGNPHLNIYDVLLQSPCNYTRTALTQQKTEIEALSAEVIKQSLRKVRIHLFAIDPVPGGSFYGSGSLTQWHDDRFYTLPEIVKDVEIILYKNERTRCFKPIVPKAHPDTSFKLLSLSGHHGTGSGNLKDQQRQFPDAFTQNTRAIQALMICKMTRFLSQHGVAFIAAHLTQFQTGPAHLWVLYTAITARREAIELFNQTYYAWLGKEQAWWDQLSVANELKKFHLGIEDQRRIHYRGHNETYLNQALLPIEGFENLEHLELELTLTFGIAAEATQDPAILLNNFHAKLTELDEVVLSEHAKTVIDPIFESLVQLIAQSYLKNHLSAAQKQALINSMVRFSEFLAEKDPGKLRRIKRTIQETLNTRKAALSQLCQELVDRNDTEQRQNLIRQLQEFSQGVAALRAAELGIELETLEGYDLIDTPYTFPDVTDELRQLGTLTTPAAPGEAAMKGGSERLAAMDGGRTYRDCTLWSEEPPFIAAPPGAAITAQPAFAQGDISPREDGESIALVPIASRSVMPEEQEQWTTVKQAIDKQDVQTLEALLRTDLLQRSTALHLLLSAIARCFEVSNAPNPFILSRLSYFYLVKCIYSDQIGCIEGLFSTLREKNITLPGLCLNLLYKQAKIHLDIHPQNPNAVNIYKMLLTHYVPTAIKYKHTSTLYDIIDTLDKNPDLCDQQQLDDCIQALYQKLIFPLVGADQKNDYYRIFPYYSKMLLRKNANINAIQESVQHFPMENRYLQNIDRRLDPTWFQTLGLRAHLVRLHTACQQYLDHRRFVHPEKDAAVQALFNLSDPKKQDNYTLANLLKARKVFQEHQTILSLNRMSGCEYTLKILACLVPIFALILAIKRLVDSGGRSMNFFKPLATQVILNPDMTRIFCG